jgi:hypothetical protein
MAPIDFVVLAAYLLGTLAIGLRYAGRNRRPAHDRKTDESALVHGFLTSM